MSEQPDGMLQLPSSYNFTRDRLANYRRNSINSQNFFEWTRNDMYRSSYAHHHSPVLLHLPRIQANRVPTTSLDTKGSFPRIELKVFMPRPTQI